MEWVIVTKHEQYVVGDQPVTLPLIGNCAILSDRRDRALRFPREDDAMLFITCRNWPADALTVEPA